MHFKGTKKSLPNSNELKVTRCRGTVQRSASACASRATDPADRLHLWVDLRTDVGRLDVQSNARQSPARQITITPAEKRG